MYSVCALLHILKIHCFHLFKSKEYCEKFCCIAYLGIEPAGSFGWSEAAGYKLLQERMKTPSQFVATDLLLLNFLLRILPNFVCRDLNPTLKNMSSYDGSDKRTGYLDQGSGTGAGGAEIILRSRTRAVISYFSSSSAALEPKLNFY